MNILATLRGVFEDQPGDFGNFTRRFWRIARNKTNKESVKETNDDNTYFCSDMAYLISQTLYALQLEMCASTTQIRRMLTDSMLQIHH